MVASEFKRFLLTLVSVLRAMEINAENFRGMTIRHGCKCLPDASVSVEDCLLAVSSVIGGANITSASRMNKAVVFFLSEIQMVDTLIECGLIIKNTFMPVLPLSCPTKKVVISNVPPFVKSEKLEEILQRYGKLMGSIKMIPLGCKNAELKHVMSFRRQAFMILNSKSEALNLSVKLNIDGKDYTIFISSETMKCFVCGGFGHVRQTCPIKNGVNANNSEVAASAEENSQAIGNEQETVTSDASAVKSAATHTMTEVSGVSENSKDVSIEATECVASSTYKVVSGIAVNDGSHNSQQIQPNMLTENSEEINSHLIDGISSQDSSVLLQADDSDIEYDDIESITDENGVSAQTQSTTDDSRSRHYTLKQINDFLDRTKGLRKPKFETYFPDLSLFLASGSAALKKASFDELDQPKRYRLKKILCSVRSSLQARGKK